MTRRGAAAGYDSAVTPTPLSAQLSYASVDTGDGSDPRPESLRLLRELRVVSALRDAGAAWSDSDEEAVLVVALDDDGRVLVISPADEIAPGPSVADVRDRFTEAGLTLWLDDPTSDDDLPDQLGEGDTPDPDEEFDPEEVFADPDEDVDLDELFAPDPVRVREFSHRGPLSARVLTASAGVEVACAEVGEWSLFSYETTEPTTPRPPSRAEAPVLVLNRPVDGAAWLEVTTAGGQPFPATFWPDAERDTQPALELESITVDATRQAYLRLLSEADGVRAELEELAERCILDVEQAHKALRAEALDGVADPDERLRALLGAFGIPTALVEAALSDSGEDGLDHVRHFTPKGWPRTVADALLAGTSESTPLTRRSRPLARAARVVRNRPLLGTAIAVGELAAGLVLTRVLPGGWKAIGVAVVADATVDLGITLARTRTDKALPPTAG